MQQEHANRTLRWALSGSRSVPPLIPGYRRRQSAPDDQRPVLSAALSPPGEARFRKDHLDRAGLRHALDLHAEPHIAEGCARLLPPGRHGARSMPSLTSSSVSMNTSLPLPFKSLTSYLVGHASVTTKRTQSWPDSSRTMIATCRRAFAISPAIICLCQLNSSMDVVTPRFSVMFPNLCRPGSLRT